MSIHRAHTLKVMYIKGGMTVKTNQTILNCENWVQEHKTYCKGSQKLNTFILVS
jgi:hypothetical protein